jgi:hypothetical protein
VPYRNIDDSEACRRGEPSSKGSAGFESTLTQNLFIEREDFDTIPML